ncbi:hypothetical protein [uncultured Anaerococcus sp.]|uniref:hypothetical protein n=1 Tax=uncultured Anaerococcus sp. TaxID=293428 RepID=UPI00280B7565|nr:hypothetical protein [uncultured Anaerococcus sp.]MDU5149782.1 hypothetical protein [Anaerococcus prevotii]
MRLLEIKNLKFGYEENLILNDINLNLDEGDFVAISGENGSGDSDIMMTDTINSFKSKFKGFHKTFKQDDLGLSLSSFLLN